MADIKLSERKHPLYEDNIDLWELYLNASKGGDDFINSDNLFSHRLEDSEDYDERLERGYYLNFCDTIPRIYNSYIFKKNIERRRYQIGHPEILGRISLRILKV